jgi:hypothetical protein
LIRYIFSFVHNDYWGWINELSVETGFIPAFGIGIPLAVLGYASYLRQRRKEPGLKQGKKYTEGRVRSSTVSAV